MSDVVRNTGNPFIASHSNSFSLCPVSRNLTDDQLMDRKKFGNYLFTEFNFY
ncbi:MAG: membrane dipeptidase [Candidatus Hodarchaeales archaeon]